MKTWLTLAEAAECVQGHAALASAERRIRRWAEGGYLVPYAGRFRREDVLAAERMMRRRRGRPRKDLGRDRSQ